MKIVAFWYFCWGIHANPSKKLLRPDMKICKCVGFDYVESRVNIIMQNIINFKLTLCFVLNKNKIFYHSDHNNHSYIDAGLSLEHVKLSQFWWRYWYNIIRSSILCHTQMSHIRNSNFRGKCGDKPWEIMALIRMNIIYILKLNDVILVTHIRES